MSSSGQDVNGNPVVIKESNITGELSRGLEVKASSILPAKDNYRQTAAFPLRLCFRPPHSSSLADSQPSPTPTPHRARNCPKKENTYLHAHLSNICPRFSHRGIYVH